MVLEVTWSNTSLMWHVNLTRKPYHLPIQQLPSNINALKARNKPDIEQWYYATLFSPVRKTLLQAINKEQFSTFPNLTVYLMKHLLPYMATEKVHTKQMRKNIKSTKAP